MLTGLTILAATLPEHPPPASLIADCGHPQFPYWRIVLLLVLLAIAAHTTDAIRTPRVSQRTAATVMVRRAKQ
jgi:hypothetical protein